MRPNETRTGRLAPLWRALIEIGFIIFLFYSNLLMGDFTHNNAQNKTLVSAVLDIFTVTNFIVALICALIGYVVVEFLRRKV